MDRLHEIVRVRGQETIEDIGRQSVLYLPDDSPLRHMDAGKL
jgi:hypothetical protein